MEIKQVTPQFSVSAQIQAEDIQFLAAKGIKTIFCNRPDGEGADQPNAHEIEAKAKDAGISYIYQPVESGKITDQDIQDFKRHLLTAEGPIHAYCRTGTRSVSLWALAQYQLGQSLNSILHTTEEAGFELTGVAERISKAQAPAVERPIHDVVIIGGGAAGVAVASSLLARKDDLRIAIIDPADVHYYQPGWTLVGAGVFTADETVRTLSSLIPEGVEWIKAAVVAFDPDKNQLTLEGCKTMQYKRLVVAPGLKLDWNKIEGLTETLGQNGVTSNYRFDLAPYTWKLLQQFRKGKAIFTQPPMPIKCAGAPQKAMYLSADFWSKQGILDRIDLQFYTAGPALFGVKEYIPSLMKYVDKYHANLNFSHNLVKIDGENKLAWFETKDEHGNTTTVETDFDMIHVCPPQSAPDFVRNSPLADNAGWVDVDQNTLRHKQYENVWSLGDVMNAPNAKTAAAARKQAPVVANNVLADMGIMPDIAHYDGYGSCPLTVEAGKIVLAEFGYGGKLLPSFPSWIIDGTQPSRLAWLLKARILPPVYWQAMLKGKEWLAQPEKAVEKH